MTSGRSTQTARTRERILVAATALAGSGGAEAVSIRAVSGATGIQAPTIYRLFGNKQGLLDAVTEQRLEAHVQRHEAGPAPTDPVDDLRLGWDGHVAYALAHPHLYRMTYVEPHPGERHPAAVDAEHRLVARIRRIDEAGRLTVTPERALLLVEAAGAGTALTLLSQPEDRRDAGLSEAAREAVIATVTTDGARASRGSAVDLEPLPSPHEASDEPAHEALHEPADDEPSRAAQHLLSVLHLTSELTPGERVLLVEWLERIVGGRRPGPTDGRATERATDPAG